MYAKMELKANKINHSSFSEIEVNVQKYLWQVSSSSSGAIVCVDKNSLFFFWS